ncbi:Glu/Leu/Phe/Val dehydrogenase dimerization domain-containing protein [Streptomyces sp. NPDC004546]|uniref:Glu/Leu/Phe/Val dehydrogenase family protein n=1 Tax=Streptomyces sp. NPDC004546 TaxID=3154282 RepID=UPI0033B9FCD0
MQDVAAKQGSLEHERLVIRRGARSGVTLMVAVHSTALGPAVGGCRMRAYRCWQDGLADALRLSEAMSYKCAAAGLAYGGGKTVVALDEDADPARIDRHSVLLDVGDLVAEFGSRYSTGPDVGTCAEDMIVVRERTPHAFCLPESHGGFGFPAAPTSIGVLAALRAVSLHRFGTPSLAGRGIVVSGLGAVGERLARSLAEQGAELKVSDVDDQKRVLAKELGAAWVEPQEAITTDTEILVPAAVGQILDHDVVSRLRCAAIVGPANNQLVTDDVADLLRQRDILWAPDFVANAGGVIYALAREVEGIGHREAIDRVHGIGTTLAEILTNADRAGRTTLATATDLAATRLRTPR